MVRPSVPFILIEQMCAEGLHCAKHCMQCSTATSRETWDKVWFCIVHIHNVNKWKMDSVANVVDMPLSANRNTSCINTDFYTCAVILAFSDNGMYE